VVSSPAEIAALVSEVHADLAAHSSSDLGSSQREVSQRAPWLSVAEVERVADLIDRRLYGFGDIEVLLAQPEVTDILVNGPGLVLVERAGELVDSGIALDAAGVRLLVDRVARWCRPRPDARHPVAHAVLPTGDRATVVLPPAAAKGPYVAIRRMPSGGLPLSELADAADAEVLRAAVRARRSILVIGPTGAGKTTLVGALVAEVPASERIVVVEDVAELSTVHPHVVRLVAADGADLRALVATSLRLRPDRIVVGEVRGAEAVDLLHALTSGHAGGFATLHATSAAEAHRRLQLLCGQASDTVDPAVMRAQWSGAFDLVVTMKRAHGGRRVVSCIEPFEVAQ
jgi:pilus assembly protein CpaF